jgi:hypothetical protein
LRQNFWDEDKWTARYSPEAVSRQKFCACGCRLCRVGSCPVSKYWFMASTVRVLTASMIEVSTCCPLPVVARPTSAASTPAAVERPVTRSAKMVPDS